MDKYLCDPVKGYLTEEAREAIKILEAGGMDRDLALATLENMWSEKDIYELED